MHGTELGSREHRALCLSTPQSVVSPPTGSMPSGTPQSCFLPTGTESSQRPFAHPQRFPLSRAPFRGQRSGPAASLSVPPLASSFGLLLHYRFRFAPFRPLLCLGPLLVPDRTRPPPSRPPLPFGILTSLQIKAFNRFSLQPVRLSKTPDSPSLPVPASISSARDGSSFQIRYAFAGWLFLKPLGTSLTMRPRH